MGLRVFMAYSTNTVLFHNLVFPQETGFRRLLIEEKSYLKADHIIDTIFKLLTASVAQDQSSSIALGVFSIILISSE